VARSAAGLGCGWRIGEIEQGLAGLGSGPNSLYHGIVPDGVATVTLVLPHDRGVVKVHPINSMLVARLPRGVDAPAKIVWRSADGTVIRSAAVP
jgi:hypothetical protein